MTSEDRDAPSADGPTVGSEDEGSRSSRTTRTQARAAKAQARAAKAGKRKHKQLPIWQETILLLGIALILAIVIKAFFVQAFYIPSQSMEPGLVTNDRILVQKVSYWGDATPQRGDVVVFKDPGEWLNATEAHGPTSPVARGLARLGLYPAGGHLVKRVIGIAGDVVTCCDDDGRLSVNGKVLDEKAYVKAGTDCAAPMAPTRCELDVGPIPKGYLLVMGDNRSNSADSTDHLDDCSTPKDCPPTTGLVPVELVVGKVFALVWPSDRFDRITRPDTFDAVPEKP